MRTPFAKPSYRSTRRTVILAVLSATLACALLSACASGPELERYPRRDIDRPFTLPKGVATWHIPIITGYFKDDIGSTFLPPIPVPLIWEQSLSDDWNLTWAPFPLLLTHQLWNTGWGFGGLGVGFGFGYGSNTGFRLIPSISFVVRQKITDETAIELTPSFTPEIPFQSDQEFRWSAGLTAGPLFQLTDTFSLKPAVGLGATHGRTSYSGSLNPASNDVSPNISADTTFNLTLWLTGSWSFARQWDLRPMYMYSGIGSSTGLQAHMGVLDFVHFW
jgi:hypothetical protein